MIMKLYGIKDFNIIKTFLKEKKKSLYRDIYCNRDIKFVISWYKIWSYRPPPPCVCVTVQQRIRSERD